MSNKIVTDDCISSFISKHYGKTSISGIGDGTVTGAISTLNSKIAVSKVNLTPASGYSIEGECYRFGRIVICSISLTKSSGVANASNGTTYITGFPNNIMDTRIDGQHWANGASSQPTSVRFTLNHGSLQGFYNGANEVINSSQPIMINFSYITYPAA